MNFPLFSVRYLQSMLLRISSAKIICELFFSAKVLKTFFTSGTCVAHKTGMPFFIIPAFSAAIFSSVSPKNSVCSSSIVFIIEICGFITFVASSLPPSPTSKTASSTFASFMHKNAKTVTSSNQVTFLLFGILSLTKLNFS